MRAYARGADVLGDPHLHTPLWAWRRVRRPDLDSWLTTGQVCADNARTQAACADKGIREPIDPRATGRPSSSRKLRGLLRPQDTGSARGAVGAKMCASLTPSSRSDEPRGLLRCAQRKAGIGTRLPERSTRRSSGFCRRVTEARRQPARHRPDRSVESIGPDRRSALADHGGADERDAELEHEQDPEGRAESPCADLARVPPEGGADGRRGDRGRAGRVRAAMPEDRDRQRCSGRPPRSRRRSRPPRARWRV